MLEFDSLEIYPFRYHLDNQIGIRMALHAYALGGVWFCSLGQKDIHIEFQGLPLFFIDAEITQALATCVPTIPDKSCLMYDHMLK